MEVEEEVARIMDSIHNLLHNLLLKCTPSTRCLTWEVKGLLLLRQGSITVELRSNQLFRLPSKLLPRGSGIRRGRLSMEEEEEEEEM